MERFPWRPLLAETDATAIMASSITITALAMAGCR
jgi:hypothetical protein